MITYLKIGDSAPVINSVDQNGDAITLEQFKGKKVVLYFYPKDNTPGCTTEGQNFRDLHQEFVNENTLIYGLSRESIKSHENFIEKQ